MKNDLDLAANDNNNDNLFEPHLACATILNPADQAAAAPTVGIQGVSRDFESPGGQQ